MPATTLDSCFCLIESAECFGSCLEVCWIFAEPTIMHATMLHDVMQVAPAAHACRPRHSGFHAGMLAIDTPSLIRSDHDRQASIPKKDKRDNTAWLAHRTATSIPEPDLSLPFTPLAAPGLIDPEGRLGHKRRAHRAALSAVRRNKCLRLETHYNTSQLHTWREATADITKHV